MPIDAVKAFEIARDHVLHEGPDPAYWEPPFSIDQEGGEFIIETSRDTLGGNAEIAVDVETGVVTRADWNPA